MKKIFFGVIALLIFVACEQDNQKHTSQLPDSIPVVTEVDSLLLAEKEVKHPEADGMFDDFIYLFMQDKSLQLDRIKFPLTWLKDGQKLRVEKSEWAYDSIYLNQSESTWIIDGNHIEEEETVPAFQSAIVEWIDLKLLNVKKYKFSRVGKQWILGEIDEKNIADRSDKDFYVFYSRFVNDEEYQMKHIHNPFYFKTFDNDTNEEIKGWVAAEQWPAYSVYMPADKINTSVYGSKEAKSNYRTFIISSPSSGMNCNLIFKYVNHRWMLVRMEN